MVEPIFPEIETTLEINKKPKPFQEYGFFYIPNEPNYLRFEFEGIQFEGVQYTWDEFDYRIGVDYPSVPEPASASGIIGIVILLFVVYKIIIKKETSNMKCAICKTKDGIVKFFKAIYNKLTKK